MKGGVIRILSTLNNDWIVRFNDKNMLSKIIKFRKFPKVLDTKLDFLILKVNLIC